ncbi:MAG TPA: hypothetical protein VMF03_14975 [Steroidobacteraceae bacterium]|nr:hypothetical protein [Steroidobacteraceae bacterium]
MRISLTTTALLAAVLLGLARSAPAQTDSAPTAKTHGSTHCQRMIDKAHPMVARMPAGVEKMSAQKEMASARTSLDKGDMTGCATHMKNVMDAVKSK